MSETQNKYNRPLTSEEVQQVIKNGVILVVSSLVFMGLFTFLVYFEMIQLYPSSMTEELVKGYAGRVEFTLRYQTLLVSWLVFNVFATIYGRYQHMALNPLDEKTEEPVQMHKNILTNSFEQILISLFAQLIFVSFASPFAILKFIPLINIIQFVGRITFFMGYPLKRAFGFQCTIAPNVFLVLYNIYKFISFLGLY